MAKPKVLVVEDDEVWQEIFTEKLEDEVTFLKAFTVKEAEELFAANPNIDVAVIDACVPGDRPTTPPLVRKIRETFTGPMIAVSSMDTYRDKLVEAGCSHQCSKEKLPELLPALLRLE